MPCGQTSDHCCIIPPTGGKVGRVCDLLRDEGETWQALGKPRRWTCTAMERVGTGGGLNRDDQYSQVQKEFEEWYTARGATWPGCLAWPGAGVTCAVCGEVGAANKRLPRG